MFRTDAPFTGKRLWAELSTVEFAALDASRAVAVLPLGATEQHGPHLPLGVDTLLVDAIVQVALPQLPREAQVLVLPTQAIGLSSEHASFAGTLSLSPETLLALWRDIGTGVARAGVRKLVLFNAHGGHVGAMDIAARELRQAHTMLVYGVSWFNLPLDAANARFDALEHRFGVHAGAVETSMMLALHPHLVNRAALQDFDSAAHRRASDFPILGNGRSAKLGWAIEDYNPQGAVGNAAAATREDGQALVDAAAAQLALLLREVARMPLPVANA